MKNTVPDFISELNDSDILIIETHVENKAKDLIQNHEIYSPSEKFEFLPGHRRLLFSLRRKVNYYIAENTKQKINSTEQTKTNSTEKQTETTTASTTEEHIEEIELQSESNSVN